MEDSTIKFKENASSGSRAYSCGQTDRQTDRRKDAHDEGSKNFLLVCERAKKDVVFPLRAMKARRGLRVCICRYAVSKSTPAFPTWKNLLS